MVRLVPFYPMMGGWVSSSVFVHDFTGPSMFARSPVIVIITINIVSPIPRGRWPRGEGSLDLCVWPSATARAWPSLPCDCKAALPSGGILTRDLS